MRIVGIDQGTTSTRAFSVSSTGNLEVLHSIEHQQIYPHNGTMTYLHECIMAGIRKSRQVLAQATKLSGQFF